MRVAAGPGILRAPAWRVLLDDAQALASGCLLAALAILVLREAGLVPGGTIGIALVLHRASGIDLPLALLVANAPFVLLAVTGLGLGFAGRTVAAMLLVPLLTRLLPPVFTVGVGSPFVGAAVGGLLCGLAMLVLFRHRSSLGGLTILLAWLHQRLGWTPVRVQLLLDACIIGAGAWVSADWTKTLASLAAVGTINAVLALNHRPGRPG